MIANPFRAFAKAQRLARAGRPLAAVIALQKILKPGAKPKRAKAASKKTVRRAPSVRLPARPAPGSFADGHFQGPQRLIRYKIYTPPGSTRRRMPLVVMMHGCGQSAEDFALGTGMNQVAEERGFLVLYPEQAVSANLGRCWNWHRSGDQGRSGEPALIAALTRSIAGICKANPDRIYIAGMSAGAAIAAITASAYPELFVAVGVHSGLTPGNVTTVSAAMSAMRHGSDSTDRSRTGRPRPTIVFHGDRDSIVNPANARAFLDRLRRSTSQPIAMQMVQGQSTGGRNFTRTSYRDATGNVMLEDWVIHRSGHTWSGGNRAGSHTDPAGPDASREMMRFFMARKRERLRAPMARASQA